MGQFANRMDEEMAIRGLSQNTRKAYLYAMRSLVQFLKMAPDRLGPEEVRRYQVWMVREQKLSGSTVNQHLSAIRFFYHQVLKRDWVVKDSPRYKEKQRLPVILNREEVAALLASVINLKHRAIVFVLYATGLRLEELRQLRVQDIDSKRMRVRVSCGKGGRARDVMLSRKLLVVLRKYWRQYRPAPTSFLFPGNKPDQPIAPSSVQRIVSRASSLAGILKDVSPHSLRHAFATHLLEDGANVVVVQRLLGHKSLQTTAIYLHVTQDYIRQTPSPLDTLKWPGQPAGSTETPAAAGTSERL